MNNILESLIRLPEQLTDGLKQAGKTKLPKSYKKIKHIEIGFN